MSPRPANLALRSASDNANAHASSSSLISACRWYHERRIVPPQITRRNLIDMIPSYRLLTRLLTLIPAVGLFLLVSANPFAQTTKLPAPSTHLSDFAGVIDNENKARIESLLQKLQEKSQIELYVATVDSTGAQGLSDFSKQLANDWNIGAKTSRTKSV